MPTQMMECRDCGHMDEDQEFTSEDSLFNRLMGIKECPNCQSVNVANCEEV